MHLSLLSACLAFEDYANLCLTACVVGSYMFIPLFFNPLLGKSTFSASLLGNSRIPSFLHVVALPCPNSATVALVWA